jgi:hypothetical protein
LLLASGPAARASSVSEEIGVGTTQTTEQNPRAGSLSNNLSARFDVAEAWTLSAGLSLTLEGATPKPQGQPFGGSSSGVASFTAGADYEASDAVTLSLGFEVSPASTQTSASTLTYRDASTGAQVTGASELRATSSSASAVAGVAYDSTGDSNLEWGLSGDVSFDHLSTDQSIVRIETSTGPMTPAQYLASCKASHKCSPALLAALRQAPATLNWAKLSVGGLVTAYHDTDFSLGVDYYAYAQDPTSVGFFSVGSRNTVSGGGGIPIAPLRFVVRPEVAHRWGDFSAKLWVTDGQYVDQTGQATRSIGGRIQYKFTKKFRMWLSASGQRDTDAGGNSTASGAYLLGASLRF